MTTPFETSFDISSTLDLAGAVHLARRRQALFISCIAYLKEDSTFVSVRSRELRVAVVLCVFMYFNKRLLESSVFRFRQTVCSCCSPYCEYSCRKRLFGGVRSFCLAVCSCELRVVVVLCVFKYFKKRLFGEV